MAGCGRPVDLKKLCTKFNNEIDSLLEFYIDMHKAASTRPHRLKYQRLLAEGVFHRGFVLMECFLSDWYVGCVKLAPKKFLDKREEEVEVIVEEAVQKLKKDYGEATCEGFLDYTIRKPNDPTIGSIKQYLDSKQWNITFKSFKDLRSKAKCLSDTWSQKVKKVLSRRQKILDTAYSIRNFIAHNSDASRDKMNTAIETVPYAPLTVKTNGGTEQRKKSSKRTAGVYLNKPTKLSSEVPNGKARTLEVFLREFKALANDLTG